MVSGLGIQHGDYTAWSTDHEAALQAL